MSHEPDAPACSCFERVTEYVFATLDEGPMRMMRAHVPGCPHCSAEAAALGRLVEAFVDWPTDLLRPSPALRDRLAERIAASPGSTPAAPAPRLREPRWERVAPGISCKVLATDRERDRVSLLVRLDPGAEYPPHRHAGVEELHLLSGQLWIDDRLLDPGDYNRAMPGTRDRRIWSETGCACVLITSPSDVLG